MLSAMLDGCNRFIVRHPKRILLGFVLVLTVASLLAPRLRQVADASVLLSDGEPAIAFNRRMARKFGNPNFVIASVDASDSTLVPVLGQIRELVTRLEASSSVRRVHSIFSTRWIDHGDGGPVVRPILRDLPPTLEDARALRDRLASTSLYRGSLVSLDGEAFGVIAEFNPAVDEARMRRVVDEALDGLSASWLVSGLPYLNTEIKSMMDQDLEVLIPLFLVAVIAVLGWALRSARGVILPLLAIAFAVVFTLGSMALAGATLNLVSNMMPMLLISIGSAYAIHYLICYDLELDERGESDRDTESLLVRTSRRIAGTIVLAGLTTAAGFLATATSRIVAIRELGLFLALGIAAVVAACFALLPAILALLPPPRQKRGADRDRPMNALLAALAWPAAHRPVPTLCVTAVLAAFLIAQIPKIEREYFTLGYFDPASSVVQQARAISRYYGGVIGFDFVVETPAPNGALRPEVLHTIARFEDWLRDEYPADVSTVISLADYLAHMGETLFDKEAQKALPDDILDILEYVYLYVKAGGSEEDLRAVVDADLGSTRINGRFSLKEMPEGGFVEETVQYYHRVIRRGERWLNERLPDGVKATAYGELPMWDIVNQHVVRGQVRSLLIVSLAVLLITSTVLRSFVGGLVCLIPVAVGVLACFGTMGALDIPLDVATSLVSAIAVGIGIDDTLHYVLAFRRQVRSGRDFETAARETMNVTGRAIVTTSIALAAGYSLLMLSGLKPIAYFGFLSAVAIVTTTLGALIILPAVVLLVRPRFVAREIGWPSRVNSS